VRGEVVADLARAEVSGIAFAARPLLPADWELRLEKRAAGMGRALRPHDGSPAPFQVFLVSVENHSRDRLRLQPGNVVRLLDERYQDHIVDYTDLYRFLLEQDKDPDSLDSIHEAFFDSGLTLEPGAAVERLLVFRSPPAKGWKKRLTLLFSSFQVGTGTFQAALPFHVEKERR